MKLYKPLKKIIKPFYLTAKNFSLWILDRIDNIRGKKDPLVPPRTMIFIGDGDYKKIGNEFLSYFLELGNLKPHHKVLDIGCGIGRMAIPLVDYLSKEGEYYGFDIVKKGIDWCQKNISGKYPNFHFEHSDIYNKSYNPAGVDISSNYTFRYPNDFFDFTFLTSVFTHMLNEDMEQYLKEINRVMKPGAYCLITYFLINEESQRLINEKKSSQKLIHRLDDNTFVLDREVPEYAIGFNESWLMKLFSLNSFNITSIYYGSWCGRKNYLSYQDIVILQKR